jgi:hypothetical protein
MIHVAAVNESRLLSDPQVDAICKALTYKATHHIAPAWNLSTVAVARKAPGATEWQLVFLDTSDQAEALGYHEDLANGLPVMKVFVKSCREDGVSESACASHELAEALVDPDLIRTTTAPGKAWACEIGDPAQSITYVVDGVEVQDFVTPQWFGAPVAPGSKLCHTGEIRKPFEVPKGGYAQWTSDLRSWHEIGAELGAGHSRPARRKAALSW